MYYQNYTFWWLIFICFLISCKKEVDFDSLERPNYEGEWQAPLFKTHITFQSLIDKANEHLDIDYLYDEKSNLLTFIYRDSISATVPEEYYKLKDHILNAQIVMPHEQIPAEYQSFIDDFAVPPGVESYTFDTTFSIPVKDIALDSENEVIQSTRIDYIILDDGELTLDIQNNFNHPIDLTLTINALEAPSGNPTETSVTLGPKMSKNVDISLNGKKLMLSENQEEANPFEATASFTVSPVEGNMLSEDDNLSLTFEMKRMSYDVIVGQLGNFSVPITEGDLALNLFDDIDDDADIYLADPEINLHIYNTSGVPLALDIKQLDFINPDESVESVTYENNTPIDLAYVPDVADRGDEAITTHTINNDNTQNLGNIFSLAPQKLLYDFGINVEGLQGQHYFLANDSEVGVIAEARIPLHGSVGRYFVSDTFSVDLAASLADEDTIVEQAEIKLITENTLPLDIYNQCYFLDEDRNIIDSLFQKGETQLLSAAQVNEEGLLVNPSSNVTKVNINRSRYYHISKSAYMVSKTRLSTAQGGDIPVKIIGSYGFDLNVGVSAKFDADLN